MAELMQIVVPNCCLLWVSNISVGQNNSVGRKTYSKFNDSVGDLLTAMMR